MRFSIEQKINIGFGLLLLILGAVGTISYRNIVASAKAQRGMSRTYETQEQIRQVQLDLKRLEVGQRSYLVTQADGDLISYRTLLARLSPHTLGSHPSANHGLQKQRFERRFSARRRGIDKGWDERNQRAASRNGK